MSKVYTVTQLTQVIKRTVDNAFAYVWVKGEVTNLTKAASGHIYFSLKDDNALLSCVWYKHQQQDKTFNPATGEVYDVAKKSLVSQLKNGTEGLFEGAVSVYAQRGVYQLVVTHAEETGKGNLHKAFEMLKAKLLGLGWFEDKYKKKLPRNPKKVAVLTSAQGAVVHDFCRISKQFGLPCALRIYPVAVQGEPAAASIEQAFFKVHRDNWAQVIVLIRGGGSAEDLSAFNSEHVAKTIFESRIPVITGIGHQTDSTIADFVADASAATPSHVVDWLWDKQEAFIQYTDELQEKLQKAMQNLLRTKYDALVVKEKNLSLLSPIYKIRLQEQMLESAARRLASLKNFPKTFDNKLVHQVNTLKETFKKNIDAKVMTLEKEKAVLNANNPYLPLEKGYSLIYSLQEGKQTLLTDAYDIHDKNTLLLEFKKNTARLTAADLRYTDKKDS